MQFRKNINSLRAVAVISVVLFHFKVWGFSGGFIGVDVFFVISGFLMTGIVFNGLQEDRFRLVEFYASRAKRILPALLVLCVALMTLGFMYLPLDDYRDLLKTIRSSLIFSSNFDFSMRGGYFDAPLHGNWLLHTWSLSVEWQFYILYPLILMVLFKLLGMQKTKLALILFAVLSLATSVRLTQTNPVFAFYMLPTRAWELIAGGLVFLYPLQIGKRLTYVFEALGLAGVFSGIIFFSEQDQWPGYLATFPVLGAALIIYGNTYSAFSNCRVLQFTGRISYSVYLWHWPFVVFLYTCGLLDSWPHVIASIVLSFILGALSFYFVESRVPKPTSARNIVLKYMAFVVTTVCISAIISSQVKHHPELRSTFQDYGQPEYASKLYTRECYPSLYGATDCKLGTGEISVIIFGDSHAQSTAAAVQLDNKQASLSWARGGCPILKNFQMHDKEQENKCRGFNKEKLSILENTYIGVPVVLFNRSGLYTDRNRSNNFRLSFYADDNQDTESFVHSYVSEYVQTVCQIAENHPLFIVKPIPEMPFSVYKGLTLQARVLQTRSDITISLDDYQKRNHIANLAIDTAAKQCKVNIIDPTKNLCPSGLCMGSKDTKPLYFDDNHLVDFGNKQLKGLFSEVFKEN
jgi:peptidoglycan/LPS O-acetylase OafA/YrhL